MKLEIKKLLMIVVLIATALPLSANALTAADIQLLADMGIIEADKVDAALALLEDDASDDDTNPTSFVLNCSVFARDVAIGSDGSDVTHLQQFLIDEGYLTLPDDTESGYFGALTQSALAAYQADAGITPAVGYFGALTRAHLLREKCPTPQAQVGNTRGSESTGAYSGTITTVQGKKIDSIVGERIMTVMVKPTRNNVIVQRIRLNVQVEEGVNPARYIEYIDLKHNGSGIASRTNARGANWIKVNDTTYAIVLDGDKAELDQNKRNEFVISVVPERDGLRSEIANFVAYVPQNGVHLKFANGNTRTWGASGTQASFTIGRAATDTTSDDTSTDDDTTDQPIDDGGVIADDVCANLAGTQTSVPANYGRTDDGVCYERYQEPVSEKPALRRIQPATGGFGEYITLTGKNFAKTGNHILITHRQTNAETTLKNFAARGDKILFQFPGKNRDFVKPNGKKVSGKTGGYSIRVISNNKQSNAERYLVK